MNNNPLSALDRYKVTLASKSPRRHELLKGLGISFEIEVREVEEIFPSEILPEEVPVFLSELKASAFRTEEIEAMQLIITADTIVLLDNKVLGKPKNRSEATAMLKQLSGRYHKVITGVSLKTSKGIHSFSASSDVLFKSLNNEEIEYYIDRCQPFDKAGSYGIQEWIGYIGIEEIKGSFYNVMGLPTQRLYTELINFLESKNNG